MNETCDTIELEDVTVEIYQDDIFGDSCRDWDNLGTMLCWHRRYSLGDEHDFTDPDEFHEWLKDNPAIVLPLYLYDHSGITMNTTGFSCGWDSGQVGYIYVERSKILKEYGWKYLTTSRIATIKKYLTTEVETYDQELTGDVYGYITRCNQCGQDLDSCWGFYGQDWKDNGLLENAEGSQCEDCNATNERLEQVTQLQFCLEV